MGLPLARRGLRARVLSCDDALMKYKPEDPKTRLRMTIRP